jgi:hypothetical protein
MVRCSGSQNRFAAGQKSACTSSHGPPGSHPTTDPSTGGCPATVTTSIGAPQCPHVVCATPSTPRAAGMPTASNAHQVKCLLTVDDGMAVRLLRKLDVDLVALGDQLRPRAVS